MKCVIILILFVIGILKMSTQVNGFIRGLVLGMVFLMEQQLPPLNLRKRPVVEEVIEYCTLLQSRMDCIQKVL